MLPVRIYRGGFSMCKSPKQVGLCRCCTRAVFNRAALVTIGSIPLFAATKTPDHEETQATIPYILQSKKQKWA
mgnify:CR=1 FL=1